MGSGVPGDRQLYRLAAIQKAASVDAAVAWGRVLSQNHASLLDGERRASGCKALMLGALLDCNKTIYFEDFEMFGWAQINQVCLVISGPFLVISVFFFC